MSQVIYNIETTRYLTSKNFKTVGAAKSYLTREAKKNARQMEVRSIYKRLDTTDLNFRELMEALKTEGLTQREAYNASRDVEAFNRDDFAIADALDFHNNIEKQIERVNMMSRKTFMEAINTPNSCSPASETYWSM